MAGGRRARTVAGRGPRSLRARLVASVMLLLAAVCAVVGIATALALRHFLIDQLDSDLASARVRFVGMQQDHGSAPPPGLAHEEQPDGADFLGPAQAPRTVGAVVVAGTVADAVVSDRGGVASTVPADAYAALAAVLPGAHPVSEDLGDLGAYRLVATLDPDGSVLVIGLPQAGVDHLLGLLVLAEGVVIGVALLVAGVAGAVAVRRELRPPERVAATAARVSDLRLDSGAVELLERVPALDTDPRTEIGQVGVALNRMLDNIAAALEARHASETRLRQFVADASHEPAGQRPHAHPGGHGGHRGPGRPRGRGAADRRGHRARHPREPAPARLRAVRAGRGVPDPRRERDREHRARAGDRRGGGGGARRVDHGAQRARGGPCSRSGSAVASPQGRVILPGDEAVVRV